MVDDGCDTTTHHISSCQLIVNIASWCTRLRTLAFKGKVLRSRHNDGDAFPSAVSRLTALESLALHNLKLLVRMPASGHKRVQHLLHTSCTVHLRNR